MTIVSRFFDLETRALKNVKAKTFAGLQDDSLSTTITFTYSDLGILNEYEPYIVFDVRDEKGNALCFGKRSTPVFNGTEFTVPFDVTSRAKSGRIQYQLVLSKVVYDVDERGVVILKEDASNIRSCLDGIVIKPSIRDKCSQRGCGAPIQSEPSVQAILRLFEDYGVVTPVQKYIDDDLNRFCLVFRTYSGTGDCKVSLDVPYLTGEGKIDSRFFDIINDWKEANAQNIASALLTKTAIDLKVDGDQVVVYTGETTDGQVLGWTAEPSNDRIPSELLVKSSLDKKLDASRVTDELTEPLDGKVPTASLVRRELAKKTDMTMAIPDWDRTATYPKGATVIYDGTIWISREGDNLGNEPGTDSDDLSWTGVSATGSVGDDGQFVAVIGDGRSRTYDVRHDLGTFNLFWSLRTVGTESEFVDARITAMDQNTVRAEFFYPVEKDSIVLMLVPGDRTKSVYCEPIGNGRDSSYVVKHNLGMYNFFTSLRDNRTNEFVRATVTAISPVSARIDFTDPVATNGITVMIAPVTPRGSDGRWVHEQIDPAATWDIRHDLSQLVTVQTFDSTGVEILGAVEQRMATLDRVIVRFSEPVAGMAVLQAIPMRGA